MYILDFYKICIFILGTYILYNVYVQAKLLQNQERLVSMYTLQAVLK